MKRGPCFWTHNKNFSKLVSEIEMLYICQSNKFNEPTIVHVGLFTVVSPFDFSWSFPKIRTAGVALRVARTLSKTIYIKYYKHCYTANELRFIDKIELIALVLFLAVFSEMSQF